jgi:outer membrane protein assembly factor BamB
MGGLVGGEIGDKGFETGDAYEGLFAAGGMMGGTSVILAGRLYYNRYKYNGGSAVEQEVVCVDLHTGEELWVRNWNNTRLAFGQLFYWESFNYQGTFALLWTTEGGVSFLGPPTPEVWNAYDASTGRWLYRMINVPPGTNIYGPNGAIYRYYIDLNNGWMMLWNTSRVVSSAGSFGSQCIGYTFNVSMYDWNTRPPPVPPGFTVTAPTNNGYEWNRTIPKGLPGNVIATFLDDRIIGTNLPVGFGGPAPSKVVFWGISVKPGEEGKLLFNTTWNAPTEWITGNLTLGIQGGQFGTIAVGQEDKIAVIWAKEIRAHYGVSLETGKLLWGPTQSQHYLDAWEGTQLTTHLIAYHRLYACGMAGILYCYNVTTGDLLWKYEAEDPYTEFLLNNNWWLGVVFISDGKIYLGHGEHSPNMPLPRGAPFICLNATTGDVIWRVNGMFRQTGWGGLAIIGDSIIVTMDTYDQRIYAIGRGPSATTVTVSSKVVAKDQSILIEGSVLDVSPGTNDQSIRLRFPNGVQAVADECMGDWMLYVYKQFPRPANVKGVWVSFDAVAPNGTWIHIGGTHTDSYGMYSVMWKPPSEGLWTIVATFPGSKSYWPSYAQTSIGVTAAPPTPETPEIPTPPDYMMIFAVVIAAVIVVAILVAYTLYTVKKLKK